MTIPEIKEKKLKNKKEIKRKSDGVVLLELDTTNEFVVEQREDGLYDLFEIMSNGDRCARILGSPQEIEIP